MKKVLICLLIVFLICGVSAEGEYIIRSPTTMTSHTEPSPYIAVASSEDVSGTTPAWKAFDADESVAERWQSQVGASPIWLRIDLGEANAFAAKNLTIHYDGAGTSRMAKFNFSGSNDNSTWTFIYNDTCQNADGNQTFNFTSNNDSYRFYKIDVITNYGATATSIDDAYIWGLNETIPENITILLSSPENATTTSETSIYFNATYNITGAYNWSNSTLYIWNSTGAIFNSTVVEIIGKTNATNVSVSNFTTGSYEWNVYACYENSTWFNCSWAGNRTFDIGLSLTSHNYNSNTYETQNETFMATFGIVGDAEVSQIKLYYNGTNYTITNMTQDGNTITINREIDIPLIIDGISQNNSFYYLFTYTNEESSVQTLGPYYQNVSRIVLVECGGNYTAKGLNITIWDEINKTQINAGTYPVTFRTSFNYWLGTGSVYKNYSFETLNNNTNSNYNFCIFPNLTYYVNMDSVFSATSYAENNYYLNNATITNLTSDLLLYLINSSLATKFYITVLKEVSPFATATVSISKFFIGEGIYKNVGVKVTDDEGKFFANLDIDDDYSFSIVKDGAAYGPILKQATCASSPCEITLQIEDEQGNVWNGYYSYLSNSTITSLDFDKDTEIVNYAFFDITGLANYFRLVIKKVMLNSTEEIICNEYSYSSSGSLTCNMSGYGGDFIAEGYVSRSPELLDKIISFNMGNDLDGLGIFAILFCVGFIITSCFLGAAISRGNPQTVIFFFGISVLLLKISGIMFFSWIIISLIELGVIFLIWLMK